MTKMTEYHNYVDDEIYWEIIAEQEESYQGSVL